MDENGTLSKKYSDLQMQQTLIIASYFSQLNAAQGASTGPSPTSLSRVPSAGIAMGLNSHLGLGGLLGN
jgi:hypothetical protein